MNTVQCGLCPKNCIIKDGESGNCRIRINIKGTLHAVSYSHPCAVHADPVEKKPLFHFFPASKAFSIATAGCNLHCKNCQNWEISQSFPIDVPAYRIEPEKIPQIASEYNCKSIAYTYTDPCAFYEYALACAEEANKKGIKNILVTAAYLNKLPMKKLLEFTDAANIDLKAFSDKFYREVCDATLKPVLNNIILAKEAGIILEITNLLIPGMNDSEKDIKNLCRWICDNVGEDTPIHFSKFTPRYLMKNIPPTPSETLYKAEKIAENVGLKYVYLGNILTEKGSDTFCPDCGKKLVERKIFNVTENIIKNGKCPECSSEIYGEWE